MEAVGHITSAGRASEPAALRVRGARKHFGPVRALAGADLALRPGEVHALMGGNGAGKSTLIKALSGVHPLDAGEIELGGRAIRPRSAHDAERLGISTVHQEVMLIPGFTLAENIAFGREGPWRPGRSREREARARSALARLGIDVDPRRELGACSVAVRQLVAVARALDVRACVLILDEPTSSLDRDETARLLDVLRRLRAQGLAIMLVTHVLEQVEAIADRATVLRDGATVGEVVGADLTRAALVEMMTGGRITPADALSGPGPGAPRGAPPARAGPALLETRSIAGARLPREVSLRVRPGESVGLAGLLGSGRSETVRLIFGAERMRAGALLVDGVARRRWSPRRAGRAGFALAPEDRRTEGILPGLSVRDNLLIALQARRGFRLLRRSAAREALALTGELGVRMAGPGAPIDSLSGGNQQKVLLARWLATRPRAFLLDEPTRGIDVAGREDVLGLMARMRRAGMALVVIAGEIPELLRSCTRAVVLRDGRSVGEAEGTDLTEGAVLAAIARHDR
ncbi:MAG: sugar ABC transporter ATP-binding protein [Phycisphaerales bacterium]|nr:sugar ABC transporter ATP-binding protein [Phycisphaerales bacterium]